MFAFAAFKWGTYTASQDVDPVDEASQFEHGKKTFCDLNEDARLYACPLARQAKNVPNGVVLLYACNAQNGFISFMGKTPSEIKSQMLSEFFESSIKADKHCINDIEEIFILKKGPWKTAGL